MNLYGYAGGDPINNSDPFGLCPEFITGRPCTLRDAANLAAGFGDALSFGLTAVIRNVTPGGDGVDYGSGLYETGLLAGAAVDVVGAGVAGAGARGRAGSRPTTEVIERATPGADGGKSVHILEKIDGKTNSVTHQVEVDGKTVHQHTKHVGKHGTERRFPDEWTGKKTIDP